MKTAPDLRDIRTKLATPPMAGRFSEAELDGLPEPVRRHLRAAIAPGTPLALSAHLRMRGSINVGLWLPFRARQIEAPHRGFVWSARAAGFITGSDHYFAGEGGLEFKVLGLFTVAHGTGPDVARSAAGRCAAEGMWVPTALLPWFGVHWDAIDEHQIMASYRLDDTDVELNYAIDDAGLIQSFWFERWGDPDKSGTWTEHPFGGEVTGYQTFDGLTIPSAGRVGWHFGTERWPEGEFFRYEISELQVVTNASQAS